MARPRSKYFLWINTVLLTMILYHWYCITIPQISWGNWDTERLGDWLQVT